MWLKASTYEQQSLLAKYTRTADDTIIHQLQHVKEKGIRYYRELIFNIIYDTISNAYPIMTDFLGEEKMKEIIHRFFLNHNCSTPQVWAMPKEFMDYINASETTLTTQYPYLSELLLFEWKEIELYMMPDKPILPYQSKGTMYIDKLVINPEMEIIHFNYPVFMLHPNIIEKEGKEKVKGEYVLLIYRDIQTKEIEFNAISYTIEKFLKLLLEKPLSLNEIEKMKIFTSSEKNQIKKFLSNALESNIILGYLNNNI